MVRIRLKIVDHDGESKKTAVWRGLGKAEAFVYKVIESREAFSPDHEWYRGRENLKR